MIKFSKITISTLRQFEYSNKDKDKQKKMPQVLVVSNHQP